MVKVKWSKEAIENIFEIREYYMKVSPKFSELLTDQIFEKEDLLISFPKIGRIVPEINNENIREIIFKNYRIIYSLFDEKNINIIAVHSSSKPLSEGSIFG